MLDNNTKRKILEAFHNDTVGRCHFGQDKVVAKVSARYYWKTANNDAADWVCYNVTSAIVQCRTMSITISVSLMLVIRVPYISL